MQVAQFDHHGEPAEVLHIRDVPEPNPGPGEIVVRMEMAPVNPSDLLNIRGEYGQSLHFPATPGFEGAGTVESAGKGLLGRYLVGKRVAVINRRTGTWSEKTVVPARQVIPGVGDLPIELAAGFFVNPATAYLMTRRVLKVAEGQWLLQSAAGSSLGRMVIALGQHYGFRTINIVRREEQAAELKQQFGIESVMAFDPARDDPAILEEEVDRFTDEIGVSFAIDPVGGGVGSAMLKCLSEGGRMLVYGTLSSEPLSISPRVLMKKNARVEGFWLRHQMEQTGLIGKLRLIRALKRLMRTGVIEVATAGEFPLHQVVDAIQAAEQPGRRGKVFLRIR